MKRKARMIIAGTLTGLLAGLFYELGQCQSESRALIEGKVLLTGKPLPNVYVYVTAPALGIKTLAGTDSEGAYRVALPWQLNEKLCNAGMGPSYPVSAALDPRTGYVGNAQGSAKNGCNTKMPDINASLAGVNLVPMLPHKP